jgi:hypothetical protein
MVREEVVILDSPDNSKYYKTWNEIVDYFKTRPNPPIMSEYTQGGLYIIMLKGAYRSDPEDIAIIFKSKTGDVIAAEGFKDSEETRKILSTFKFTK